MHILSAHKSDGDQSSDVKDLTLLSDEELAQRVTDDSAAFGLLMQRYESKLLSYIRQKTRVAREGAEDILQESFLKAYQNINSFDSSLSFSSWIYRIVYNTTVSQWRRANSRPEGNSVEVDDDFLARLESDTEITLEIDREIMKDQILGILDEMDEKYRNVLILRFMEGMSYDEISDVIQKPMGTVATYISRAKQQFKKRALIDKRLGDT